MILSKKITLQILIAGTMKYIAFFPFIISFLIMGAGCTQQSINIKTELDTQLEKNRIDHGIPAQSVAVVNNHQLVYSVQAGSPTMEGNNKLQEDSIYPLYSVGKLFASTLIMLLEEEGKIQLKDKISKHISDLPTEWNEIKIEDLLNHSSGLPEYYTSQDGKFNFPESLELAIKNLENKPSLFSPGSKIQYTQTNYLLIRMLLEKVERKDYRQIVKDKIFTPLNITEIWLGKEGLPQDRVIVSYYPGRGEKYSKIDLELPDYTIAHGTAYGTLKDTTKFVSSIAAGQLVSKESLLNYWKPYQLLNGETGYFATGWDYGQSGSWHELGHDGGALVRVRVLFKENLDDYYVIVYLTNGNKDGVWTRTLVDSVQKYVAPDFYTRISNWF